ncbi:MerR family transcriptional regulator [Leifsonia sp. SIMBA_070]|uniref:MerR family transcriptional regulator n=1 Tax=Leifsonia sp. SIMBA_070 TaxID=3085810 RepID=UPI00397BE28E
MANPPEQLFTTVELGRQVGYSAQQVRDLERLGVIPEAARGANGYRRYRREHLVTLRAYRALAASVGPVPARRLMPRLVAAPIDEVAESIDELHATLAGARARVRGARRAMEAVLGDSGDVFAADDAMTIGELADALGVRPSALRHWEHEGLVAPGRLVTGARSYGAGAIAQARLVAVLREGAYPIPTIGRVLDQLRTGRSGVGASRLLDARLADLTRRSVALLEAAGHLHAFLLGKSERSEVARG